MEAFLVSIILNHLDVPMKAMKTDFELLLLPLE